MSYLLPILIRSLLCLFFLLSAVHLSAAEKPNILFIAVDDLKPALGCYGDPVAKSPQIDRLAAHGTVFLNNQCQFPTCGPSRASLLTGLRPDSTKVYDLKTKMRKVNPDILTLPQYLKQQGYETVGMGKIFDPRCVDGRKYADKPSWSQPFMWFHGKNNPVGGFLNPKTVAWMQSQMDANGKPVSPWSIKDKPPTEGSEDVPNNAYNDGATAEAAVEWIKKLAKKDQPFFLAVGFQKPHLPFVAPKKYWDLYDRSQFDLAAYQKAPVGTPAFTLQPGYELRGHYRVPKKGPLPDDLQRELIHGYYACVSYIDTLVGDLLDALDQAGIADNTIVVLWGDHGWHLGDHGMWCKHSVYEQAARSPLIISVPGQKVKGAKVESPTEFTDIFPTLTELAGLKRPEVLEGVSLVPVLNDPDHPVREVALTQYNRTLDGKKLMGYSFRDKRFRYTEWRERKDGKSKGDGPVLVQELYDYENDPLETRNLVEDPKYAADLARLQAAAHKELAAYGIK